MSWLLAPWIVLVGVGWIFFLFVFVVWRCSMKLTTNAGVLILGFLAYRAYRECIYLLKSQQQPQKIQVKIFCCSNRKNDGIYRHHLTDLRNYNMNFLQSNWVFLNIHTPVTSQQPSPTKHLIFSWLEMCSVKSTASFHTSHFGECWMILAESSYNGLDLLNSSTPIIIHHHISVIIVKC